MPFYAAIDDWKSQHVVVCFRIQNCCGVSESRSVCLTLCDLMDYTVHGILQARTEVGSLSLLQETFPTQGLNPGLPHCGQIFTS